MAGLASNDAQDPSGDPLWRKARPGSPNCAALPKPDVGRHLTGAATTATLKPHQILRRIAAALEILTTPKSLDRYPSGIKRFEIIRSSARIVAGSQIPPESYAMAGYFPNDEMPVVELPPRSRQPGVSKRAGR